ncbi:Exocyst complex component Sec10 [Novymonas esmeraldas]|uniref:Exocyst complex component Sec10 n=1 Tax=Novymonas esmeraldas TaxID=1808958 RepID=A0AAW0EKJ3_9TRYP
MDGDGNGQQRRPRRVLRRSAAARQAGQDGDGEAETSAAPSVRFAPSVTAPTSSSAPATRAPAPRLAGPSAMPAAAGSRSGSESAVVAAGRASSAGAAAARFSANQPTTPVATTPPPAAVSTSSAAEAAMQSAMAGRRLLVDRTLFSAIAFSSPLFVNNVAQRLLYPVLQRHRTEQKRIAASGGPGGGGDGGGGGGGGGSGGGGGGGGAGRRSDSEAARLLGSDGTSLFGNSRMPMSMRARVGALPDKRDGPAGADGRPGGGGGSGGGGSATVDYTQLAGQLTTTLEEAAEEVRRLLEEEEALLHREEVRCKRVEIQEKRRLTTVRLGLEGTSARLQLYENRVSNAQAATAGIEQHLAQSNARVQRGKSVSQLLRYFKMMTGISGGELRVLLESISATRKTQRAAVTARWASGRVSAFRPRFYTTVVSTAAPSSSSISKRQNSGSATNSTTSRVASATSRLAGVAVESETAADGGVADRATAAAAEAETTANGAPRRLRVFRGGARRRGGPTSDAAAVAPAAQARAVSPQRSPQHTPRSMAGGESGAAGNGNGDGDGGDDGDGGAAGEEEDGGDDGDEAASMEDGGDGDAIVDLAQVRMQRSEAAAVAAGLDRLFALRYCTESQVEWCQRLVLLANELGDLAPNVKNIRAYVDWLRKELVSDLFHVVTCFNEFYDEHPQTAVHQAYGRALLKTLGRISSLYNTLTPSNDELLSLFFSRSINDLGLILFSEWSPRPLPGLPPLPQSSEVRAMDHYRQHTDKELQRTFRFLLDRIRRNVVVVETIFGTTNTARQQLLSRVTDGVVKPFLSQQIKLAETQATTMAQAEGGLTPRTKRRCGARVADVIAYHHTMETRLYSFYQEYMKELKTVFSANEVEFLGKFVDLIFVQRGAYSRQRTELELLNRYFTLIEERYTRSLHAVPDEFFDLREAHMSKMKDVMSGLTEVAGRVKTYATPTEVGPYVFDLIKATLLYVGNYLEAELRKVLDSLRTDRDNWRVKPKSEDELLQPPKPESQQCAMRMLLFAQSSLMSMNDSINVICVPLLQQYPRLVQDVEEARGAALEAVDERAERVLNMCLQAILLRALSILQHYQLKSDYLPKVDTKNSDAESVAPPCTRACTLFCYYITRQLDMAAEFIRLSNGQVPQRQTSSQMASGGALGATVQQHQQQHSQLQQQAAVRAAAAEALGGAGSVSSGASGGPGVSATGVSTTGVSAVRARARTMNLQQLLYGDGGPSSFVRTLGVCLYRGIAAHLKSFSANDRGALVYKQDVTAYKEAMAPLTSTPGLGGAVVEVLFQMLKETSSLLIMPLDHIREVKESGSLKLMSAEEKLRYLRIRQDVRSALKIISQ